jgi:hypothetical protein
LAKTFVLDGQSFLAYVEQQLAPTLRGGMMFTPKVMPDKTHRLQQSEHRLPAGHPASAVAPRPRHLLQASVLCLHIDDAGSDRPRQRRVVLLGLFGVGELRTYRSQRQNRCSNRDSR